MYTNSVGVDHDTIKNGNAMITDPFGEIIVESNALEDDVVIGHCTADKIEVSSGHRYLRARRPELYGKEETARVLSTMMTVMALAPMPMRSSSPPVVMP